jgi:hypothetical protein
VSLGQTYTGRCRYRSDIPYERHTLFVAVPCFMGEELLDALLDTGSQWCILPASLASRLGYDQEGEGEVAILSSRLGTLTGRLERIPVCFRAEEGSDVTVEATYFLCSEWTGPAVLGWKGCLERIRLALDPSEEWFYFAEL